MRSLKVCLDFRPFFGPLVCHCGRMKVFFGKKFVQFLRFKYVSLLEAIYIALGRKEQQLTCWNVTRFARLRPEYLAGLLMRRHGPRVPPS